MRDSCRAGIEAPTDRGLVRPADYEPAAEDPVEHDANFHCLSPVDQNYTPILGCSSDACQALLDDLHRAAGDCLGFLARVLHHGIALAVFEILEALNLLADLHGVALGILAVFEQLVGQ